MCAKYPLGHFPEQGKLRALENLAITGVIGNKGRAFNTRLTEYIHSPRVVELVCLGEAVLQSDTLSAK